MSFALRGKQLFLEMFYDIPFHITLSNGRNRICALLAKICLINTEALHNYKCLIYEFMIIVIFSIF